MKYTPLHVHSEYSLLDGLTKIRDLVSKAKADGMTALALTDHGVMYGIVEFYQRCREAGIKPILGMEAYIVEKRQAKEASEEQRFHLVLLAKNNQGYKNLLKLTTRSHLEGFYYRPRIDWELLEKYHEGLIGLSACLQGEIPQAIIRGIKEEKQEALVARYQRVFGADNFYLEVQHHPNIPEQKKVNDRIFALGKKMGIAVVATNDTHYLNAEDAEAQDILLCLQTKKTISEKNRMCMLGEDFSLFTSDQMTDFFRANPEVLENTNRVADQCDVEIPLGKTLLPHFEVPGGKTNFDYLKDLCLQNIARRYQFDYQSPELKPEAKVVMERLNYELGIIEKTGYASYFLIVQDFINWAKQNGIVVGPGRGSAAGSIVSYLLNITNLDPLKYELLFERFLNPERISMPDIDTDFADERRDEVIRYVESKYGKDHVAQIITFGTMAARAAVRDVGRVLELPYAFCDKVAKLIPMNLKLKLKDVIEKVAEVKELYKSNEEARRLLDFAKKLEGVARHASTHACGIVITPDSIDNHCPRQFARDQAETVVIQYSLHPVEDLGLLKMDFLGLKNLTIIERTCEIIEKMHGVKINIDEIPLDDDKAYQLFRDGQTTGLFQFESSGMKRYLKQLLPNNLEDLISMVALYRPGPMELIPDFIERKHGRQKVEYVHPKLKDSLNKTFGIAIYQEQVMQIARDLAGFSLGEADVLRKAMGKKIARLLAEQKDKFVAGCIKNNISRETAEAIFSFMEPFAGYGFPRAHAACYAYIAYQTAYLKANYPAEFMASLLTSEKNNLERVAVVIDECRQMGLEILPPDINESYSTFTVVAESLKQARPLIRFGLDAIRNVGGNVSKTIIHLRKEGGPFASLEDFLTRVSGRELNKKSLEGLIKSGALDLFGERGRLLDNLDKALLFIREQEQAKIIRQQDIFGANGGGAALRARLILRESFPAEPAQVLAWEKEFLGLYVSAHPFRGFQARLKGMITPLAELRKNIGQCVVRVGGVVSSRRKITTKKGEPMLFVGLEDTTANLELLIFPRLYKESEALWEEGKMLVVDGTLSDKDDSAKILANQAWELKEDGLDALVNQLQAKNITDQPKGRSNGREGQGSRAFKPLAPPVIVRYPVGASKELAQKVKMLFMTIEGKQPVCLQIHDKLIKTQFRIRTDAEARQQIEALLGAGAVALKKE